MTTTPDQAAAKMVANLPEKTGKSLEQWLALVKQTGLQKHGEIVTCLKSDHGVTHGFANLIAHHARESSSLGAAAEDPVATQYSGDKASLKPIYDAVLNAVQRLGRDVEVAPKKSYVSLRRAKQFALIQPTTKTRVDIGIQLKGVEPTERLEASGSFNSMVSHRVRVTDASQVDDQLVGWLKQAYDSAS